MASKDNGRGQGLVFMGVAFELVGMCGGGYFLGDYIDEKMGWKNFASTYLVLILLIGWFVHLIYLLRRFEKENPDPPP
jgi:membrane protein DedA with SNARE-associated domain